MSMFYRLSFIRKLSYHYFAFFCFHPVVHKYSIVYESTVLPNQLFFFWTLVIGDWLILLRKRAECHQSDTGVQIYEAQYTDYGRQAPGTCITAKYALLGDSF